MNLDELLLDNGLALFRNYFFLPHPLPFSVGSICIFARENKGRAEVTTRYRGMPGDQPAKLFVAVWWKSPDFRETSSNLSAPNGSAISITPI